MNKLPIIEKAKHSRGIRQSGSGNNILFIFLCLLVVIVLFIITGSRLFQLTIVKGDYYRRLSDENRIREIVIESKRGTILDRGGQIIAESTSANIRQLQSRLLSKRVYREAEATAHVVGYRQPADSQNFDNDLCLTKLELGDQTGKKGVEKVYECRLRGVNGRKLVELDTNGKQIKTLGLAAPINGQNVTLALDLKLQKKAHELFNTDGLQKGAVIALRPKTGEILTLYSNPTYNPQDFEDKKQSRIHQYISSKDHVLFNRGTEGSYPPGSIFKLFIATGALEEKKIKEDTLIEDTGEITAGPLKFGNWYFLQYGKTEGELNIVKALRRSNDIFFYKAGERLGVDHIKKWATNFGFGRKTAFPFDQSEGIIPSPFWKEDTLGEQWYLGDTYNLSIGQGYLLTTPLQIAQASAVFANGGSFCIPQLLKDEKPSCESMNISQKTIQLIREGMKQACETGGTGWPFFEFKVRNEKVKVGCKTGTAEAHGVGKPKPHAWFTVFAPYDNPEIVLTVLVENGGEGSNVAAPIAKELLTTYFER